MWIYVVLAVFFIGIQLLLTLFGGWLINFVFGVISLLVAVQYFNLMDSGLPLGYIIPLIVVVMATMLWISALLRSDFV